MQCEEGERACIFHGGGKQAVQRRQHLVTVQVDVLCSASLLRTFLDMRLWNP